MFDKGNGLTLSLDSRRKSHGEAVGARKNAYASSAMIAGGALMIALWPIYTTLHGPTSVNERGELLGGGPEFWGAMMEGPSLLLMAAGLYGSRHMLNEDASNGIGVGMVLALIGLAVPGIGNLAILAVWPPLLAPLLGAGFFMLAREQRRDNSSVRPVRRLLVGIGLTQIFAFLWVLIVRPDMVDQIDGYRIYGVIANVLFGLLWILLGVRLQKDRHES